MCQNSDIEIYKMSSTRITFFRFYKHLYVTIIVLVSAIECRDTKWQNTTNELSLPASTQKQNFNEGLLRQAFNHIQITLWNELTNPIPMIAATITYMVLKFTGVFGFLRLLYTIINQSNT